MFFINTNRIKSHRYSCEKKNLNIKFSIDENDLTEKIMFLKKKSLGEIILHKGVFMSKNENT